MLLIAMADQKVESQPKSCFCLFLILELIILCGKIFLSILSCILRCVLLKPKKILKNDVVLVTGAGRGLGREIAKKFASLDATLVLWDVDEEAVQVTAAGIRESGGRAHGYKCDVSDWNSVRLVGKRVQEEVGDIAMLVNNAGLIQNQPILNMENAKIKRSFEVNILAHFWTIKFFLPRMLELNKGHIIAISSTAGLIGWINMSAYSSTKFAIFGMMESIEEEIRLMGKSDCIHFTTAFPVAISSPSSDASNTRYRFLLPVIEVEYAAAQIVDAVLRDETVLTIPRRMYYSLILQRLFPRKVFQYLLDFFVYNNEA